MERKNRILKTVPCPFLLLVNSLFRILLARGFVNELNTMVTITGIIMLAFFFAAVIVEYVNSKFRFGNDVDFGITLITMLIFGISASVEVIKYGIPLQHNIFLMISVLSIAAILGSIQGTEEVSTSTSKTSVSKKKKSILLMSLMLLTIPFISIPTISASTIIDHQNIVSADQKFRVAVYVYLDESSVPGKKFYGFHIHLHTDVVAYFHTINKIELLCPNACIDDWQPKAGLGTGGSISLTPSGPGLSISLPLTDIAVSGGFTNRINFWMKFLSSQPQDIEIGAKVWTTDSDPLHWRLSVDAESWVIIAFLNVKMWQDTMKFSNLPTYALTLTTNLGPEFSPQFYVQTLDGNQYYQPGTYTFEEGPIAVWVIPNIYIRFRYWITDKYGILLGSPITIEFVENTSMQAFLQGSGGIGFARYM